jgi:hypothetical protein
MTFPIAFCWFCIVLKWLPTCFNNICICVQRFFYELRFLDHRFWSYYVNKFIWGWSFNKDLLDPSFVMTRTSWFAFSPFGSIPNRRVAFSDIVRIWSAFSSGSFQKPSFVNFFQTFCANPRSSSAFPVSDDRVIRDRILVGKPLFSALLCYFDFWLHECIK